MKQNLLPIFLLWLAITIPVIGTGAFLYQNLKHENVVVSKAVVVTPSISPTATPSATATPILNKSKTPVTVTVPVVKGGVK